MRTVSPQWKHVFFFPRNKWINQDVMSVEWLRTALITSDDGGASVGAVMTMFQTLCGSHAAARAKGASNSKLSSGLCSLLIKCVCARQGARVWVRVACV